MSWVLHREGLKTEVFSTEEECRAKYELAQKESYFCGMYESAESLEPSKPSNNVCFEIDTTVQVEEPTKLRKAYKYPQDVIIKKLLQKLGGEACLTFDELKLEAKPEDQQLTPDEIGRQKAFVEGIPGLNVNHGGWFLSLSLEKDPRETSLNFLKKEPELEPITTAQEEKYEGGYFESKAAERVRGMAKALQKIIHVQPLEPSPLPEISNQENLRVILETMPISRQNLSLLERKEQRVIRLSVQPRQHFDPDHIMGPLGFSQDTIETPKEREEPTPDEK